MQRSTIVSALVLAGTLAMPAITMAQANSPDRDQTVVGDTDRGNDRSDWGWLGFLGLAGLLGLKRKERDKQRDHVTTRQAM